MDYPQTAADELSLLYEDIDEKVENIQRILPKHFEVRGKGLDARVYFGEAEVDDYVAAMDEDPDTMVRLFMKLSGYAKREFHRKHGVDDILGYAKRKTSFASEEDIKIFGKVLAAEMPANLGMEAILFTFAKAHEDDQRRFFRQRYEKEVRQELRERGIPNDKREDIPGQPDFAIPPAEPFQVLGEVRVFHLQDGEKRFKEFGSEAREAKKNYDDIRFVVVANPPEVEIEDDNDRKKLRKKIDNVDIDLVVFNDEMDDLVAHLQDWNVPQQRTLE